MWVALQYPMFETVVARRECAWEPGSATMVLLDSTLGANPSYVF